MGQIYVGLDIGRYSIKALRIDASYRGFEVLGFDEEVLDTVLAVPELDPEVGEDGEEVEISAEALEDAFHDAEDEAIQTALLELAARGALDGELVHVAIPPDLVLTSVLSFPFDDPRQLQAVIPPSFEELIPVDIDELVVDYYRLGESAKEEGLKDVLAAGIKQEDLEIFLELWDVADVKPSKVVMGDVAMLSLASYLLGEMTTPYAIVDVGHRFTRVLCVEPAAEEGEPARMGYVRSFQWGGHGLSSFVQDMYGCSYQDAELYKHHHGYLFTDDQPQDPSMERLSNGLKKGLRPLVRELRRTFQAHAEERRNPIERVFLCGGTSRLRNLPAWLSDQLGVGCEMLPVAGEELAMLPEQAGRKSTMAQALSLGLLGTQLVGDTSEINFRTGRYAFKGARSWVREKMIGMIIIAMLLVCVLGSMFSSRYFALDNQLVASEKALEQATQRLFGEKLTNAEKIKRTLQGDNKGQSVLPTRTAYDYFYEIYSRTPTGTYVAFEELEVDLFRQLVKLRARTETAANVDIYVEKLEEYPCFREQVQKGSTTTVGEEVKFDLTISPECPEQRQQNDKKKKKK